MAVVQISRIQIRRGQKNQGEGLPQLASGELAWAIDTQELFIGNGSLNEGAPAVGNTKILTQSDDIFSLTDTYSYKKDSGIQTGQSLTSPYFRTLQDRLDDYISIRSFGATGDQDQDATEILQRAIDQLFGNNFNGAGVEQNRVTLYLNPGVYTINNWINIPPFASIVGAGPEKTVIRCVTNESIRIVGTDGEIENPTSETQARRILLKGFTLSHAGNGIGLQLGSCKDSDFSDIDFIGSWEFGQVIAPIPTTSLPVNTAVLLDSFSPVIQCTNNLFFRCKFNNWNYGVIANKQSAHNIFKFCEFNMLGEGVNFGTQNLTDINGDPLFPMHNQFLSCQFTDIHNQAINIIRGEYNLSKNNYFRSVGNAVNAGNNYQSKETQSLYAVIHFENPTNQSDSDYFLRSSLKSTNLDSSIPFVEEISGSVYGTNYYTEELEISQNENILPLLRLPGAYDQTYVLHYYMSNPNIKFNRYGKLTLMCEGSPTPSVVRISDDYDHYGEADYDTGDNYLSYDITFSADFVDEGTVENPQFSIYLRTKTGTAMTGNTIFRYKLETHRFSF